MSDPGQVQPATGTRRIVLLGLGWFFTVLGIAGAVLPILPTTPFLILALWAFSQSSRRMHDWLYRHPVFGPRLRLWREHRVIPLRVKLVAWTTMAATLAYATFVTRLRWPYLVAMATLMLIGVIYVATKPSRVPPGAVP